MFEFRISSMESHLLWRGYKYEWTIPFYVAPTWTLRIWREQRTLLNTSTTLTKGQCYENSISDRILRLDIGTWSPTSTLTYQIIRYYWFHFRTNSGFSSSRDFLKWINHFGHCKVLWWRKRLITKLKFVFQKLFHFEFKVTWLFVEAHLSKWITFTGFIRFLVREINLMEISTRTIRNMNEGVEKSTYSSPQ